MIDAIQKLTEGTKNRALLMIGRCILRAISDDKAVQLVQAQLLADEIQDDVERIQQYGYTSVPLPGAEGVVVFVGGNRDHGLLIACEDRRYRLKGLVGGEVALYTDEGDFIKLGRGNTIAFKTGRIDIDAPDGLHINGDVVAGGISLIHHVHGGISPGGSNTNPPT
jgi:phage baseplate assembly protein V